jgi:hypothetical protein
MIQPTLFFGALLSTFTAGIYYYVGYVLSQRQASSQDSRMAWTMFIVWWYALAATTLSGAILSLLGALGIVGLPLFVTVTIVNLLATCVALFGLMYYLLYLFTGSRHLLVPLTLFYIFYYAFLIYYVLASDPVRVSVDRWRAALVYENQIKGPLFLAILLLLVFPQIIGSLAYFTLYFRIKNPTQKYRVLLVSWSIIIWFLSAFLASIAGLSELDWWQVVSRLIGLSAALAIRFAYQPPLWIKQRYNVLSIADENAS